MNPLSISEGKLRRSIGLDFRGTESTSQAPRPSVLRSLDARKDGSSFVRLPPALLPSSLSGRQDRRERGSTASLLPPRRANLASSTPSLPRPQPNPNSHLPALPTPFPRSLAIPRSTPSHVLHSPSPNPHNNPPRIPLLRPLLPPSIPQPCPPSRPRPTLSSLLNLNPKPPTPPLGLYPLESTRVSFVRRRERSLSTGSGGVRGSDVSLASVRFSTVWVRGVEEGVGNECGDEDGSSSVDGEGDEGLGRDGGGGEGLGWVGVWGGEEGCCCC